jgi:predicted protein tyrosine phosphatase
MKISVKISVSERDRSLTITLSDIGATDEEWALLSEIEKRDLVMQYVDSMPDQPVWELDSFDET